MILIILTLMAFFTSIISAIIGMGGGILLLSVMTFFMPIQVIIPVHGLIQLISNSTRLLYLKDHIQWKFFWFFLIGMPFGAALSAWLLKGVINESVPYLIITLLIFYAVFKPKRTPHFEVQTWGWILVGFSAGAAGILAGAVGPLIAPFFIRDDLKKEEIVATKASMQMVTHFSKVPVFLTLGFDFNEHGVAIVLMAVAAIIGTRAGIHVLGQVNESVFKKLYKSVLLISGIRVAYKFISFYL